MHSLLGFAAHLRRWARPRAYAAFALGCGALAVLTAPATRAQTFVAEWAQADIGRLGPTGMAIDTIGGATYLYVSDQPNGRVIKIDLATGTRVAAWGQTGNGPVEFNSPFGIAIEPTTHDLYVVERDNNRVQRITSSGKFVMGWGEGGTGPGQFSGPMGIAADAAGNVYVVDRNNDRVEKFQVQSTAAGWQAQYVTSWGGKGAANGQFDEPYGITLDPQGNLWVADARNHRLQKFDTNGRFLAAIGTFGTGDGQFVTPTWVNFDATGAYYVAETNSDPLNAAAPDRANQRIQKFSPTGVFQYKWGTYGEAGGQFKLPFDVVVDNAGYAYVSDYYNTRVQKFSLPGAPTGGTGGGGGGGGGTAGSGAQFSNVSSRLRANPSRPLIAGFVVAGSGPKQLLVRAVGPALAQYGVSTPLPNPKLQIYSGTTVVADNEDWAGNAGVSSASSAVGAFALPAGSRDAALVVTLQPGAYSAQVVDNGGDGVALVEVYDADTSTTARLINLSTRGFVDTGEGVLVAGFVVKGSTSKRVLIRGVGPALAGYGVTGVLANPVLKVYTAANALVAQNDDWGTGQLVAGGSAPATATEISAAATATGAFALPAGSADAAVVVTLPPGAYSAIVSGASDATGNALVELYELAP